MTDTTSPVKRIAQTWPLPQGWERVTLGEVCLPVEKVKPEETPQRRFTYIDIASIDNSSFRITQPKTYLGQEAPSRARQRILAGDTLLSTVRTYLRNIALVPPEYDGQVASTGFCVLRPSEAIYPGFLFYAVQTDDFISALDPLQRGTSYPAVRNDDVRAQSIALPPVPEQRGIVAEIEKHFTRLDAAVASLQRSRANLKRYRASVLKAACEGRLVPTEAELARREGRAYEPASMLLDGILRERRARWEGQERRGLRGGQRRVRYREPAGPETSSPPELPEGWAWATVEQLTSPERPCAYGILQPGPHVPGGIPIIRVGDILDGRVADGPTLKRVAPSIAKQYPRTELRGGEVVTTLVGTIGRTAIVPPSLAGANTARAVGVISIVETVEARWVDVWFRNPQKVREMTAKAHEVARKTLNLEDVRDAAVAVPPYAEQRRIVSEVERHLSVIQAAEAVVDANIKRAERLRQAILRRAFEGKLVSQDPTDEPASVLLERIRAEREQAGRNVSEARRRTGRRRKTQEVSA